MFVTFAEPFDPQRAGPARQLTRTAESDRSRRFAFVALSASNHADSPSLPEPHAVPAGAALAVFTGAVPPALSEPPPTPPHGLTPAESMPKKPPANGLPGCANVCQKRNDQRPGATHCQARGYDMASPSIGPSPKTYFGTIWHELRACGLAPGLSLCGKIIP